MEILTVDPTRCLCLTFQEITGAAVNPRSLVGKTAQRFLVGLLTPFFCP